MTIPDFQSLMLPLLRRFDDGQIHRLSDFVDPLAVQFDLSDEEREELLPSGQQSTFRNRIGWAAVYLTKAGLLARMKRGHYQIADRGRQTLAEPVQRIDIEYLSRFDEFREFRNPSRSTTSLVSNKQSDIAEVSAPYDPYETLERSYRELRDDLAQELLSEVKSSPPEFFERLVVDLLVSMGYGGSRSDAAQAVGRSGDGGIDGIIKEDRLGLDAVYVQAKRWDGVVGRPIVQGFAGSLEGHRARKGVMITTGDFSRSAHEYVGMIEKRIVLIDGDQLAQLMIDYGIGVSEVASYKVFRVDSDFFSEE
jgi:restriction system protein